MAKVRTRNSWVLVDALGKDVFLKRDIFLCRGKPNLNLSFPEMPDGDGKWHFVATSNEVGPFKKAIIPSTNVLVGWQIK